MKKSFLTLILTLLVSLAFSQTENHCAQDDLTNFFINSTQANNASESPVDLSAAQAEINQKNILFEGNVVVKRGDEEVQSQKLNYLRDTKNIELLSETTYGTPYFVAKASNGTYNLNSKQGQLNDVNYLIKEKNAKGRAKTVEVNQNNKVQVLSNASYTTCSRQNPFWHITSNSLTLDQENSVGTAKQSVFYLKDVPILYLPYFSFPLNDERKSGFLLPRVGLSESRGLEITTPYYFNIAPNVDATLSPRIMEQRGLLLGSELRYLTEDLSGYFSADYLPRDIREDRERWAFKTAHTYRPNDKLTIRTDFQRVSDDSYIDDLSPFLNFNIYNDSAFLVNHITAEYALANNYQVTGKIQDYQVSQEGLSNNERPYALLPSISGNGFWEVGPSINIQSETELNNFDRENRISGWRLHQKVSASKRFENTFAYTEPKVSYQATKYNLRSDSELTDSTPSRFLPTFSLDNGVFFERDAKWFGEDTVQTVEPRLFYLYTPFRKHENIPNFDANLATNSYATMFSENRFTGKDRIGDANQLTTAVTSRVISKETGKELAKLSVGQIQYFQDRNVSLAGSVNDDDRRSRSNVIAEVSASVYDDFNIGSLIHYDTDNSRTEQYRWRVTYAPDKNKSISLSQDFSRGDYRQLNLSGVWKFHDNWQTFGKWGYSQNSNETVDALAGIEYNDCCVGVRFVARRQRNNLINNQAADNQFFLQFSFNSLGKIGNNTSQNLDTIIQNYKPLSSY